MEALDTLESLAVPLMMPNVDTDIITPMRRLTGGNARPLADYAFEAWRYLDGDADSGAPDPTFVLNEPRYEGASILLTGENFGCGSSRESAPRALLELGFRCLIGTSFGDIFFNNCFQQGILPIELPNAVIELLRVHDAPVSVDLAAEQIVAGDQIIRFEVNQLKKRCLLEGLDDIEMTLALGDQISRFQQRDRKARPWVYEAGLAPGEPSQ